MMMSGYGMNVVGLLLNLALVLGLWAVSVAMIIATLRAYSGSSPKPDAEQDPRQDVSHGDLVHSGH